MGRIVVGRQAAKEAARGVGAFLRTLRVQGGLTQAEAGERLGVDPLSVRRWELGINAPSGPNLDRIARVYDVRVSAILAAGSTSEAHLGAEERELVQHYRGAPRYLQLATLEGLRAAVLQLQAEEKQRKARTRRGAGRK